MRPFKYTSAKDLSAVTAGYLKNNNAKFLAGGTNLLDLMKEDVMYPDELIDLGNLKPIDIYVIKEGVSKGSISISAFAKNTETANHDLIRKKFPLLTQAILAGASAQIRNMASNGGNLLQRTRCSYFYDTAMPCNKRSPGTGCGAKEGVNRMHAIFGWSDDCVAVYPSDMAIALAALDVNVIVQNNQGFKRIIPFADFHRLPGTSPGKDTNLIDGEVITAIEIPENNFANHYHYLKVRDRSSYAFALVSVAVGLVLEGSKITKVRIALGGVSHKPWRALNAEALLLGKEATAENFNKAAEAEMNTAKPLAYNRFKIKMGKQSIVRALEIAFKGNLS